MTWFDQTNRKEFMNTEERLEKLEKGLDKARRSRLLLVAAMMVVGAALLLGASCASPKVEIVSYSYNPCWLNTSTGLYGLCSGIVSNDGDRIAYDVTVHATFGEWWSIDSFWEVDSIEPDSSCAGETSGVLIWQKYNETEAVRGGETLGVHRWSCSSYGPPDLVAKVNLQPGEIDSFAVGNAFLTKGNTFPPLDGRHLVPNPDTLVEIWVTTWSDESYDSLCQVWATCH
jgi:hypothetical protein